MTCRLIHATSPRPGAIAILQLVGDCGEVLGKLTGVHDWPPCRMRLVDLADIDRGLAVRLNDKVAQIMPHGGPRVVQRLTAKLIELGVELAAIEDLDPWQAFPEAFDEIDALMLQTLARAESPLAIDVLLDHPRRWRELARDGQSLSKDDRSRSARLNRLIDPPIVVLAGAPNVGKSTLSNALLGRAMSITMDLPGTTRDYTAGRIDLGGLVVDWHDTPGVRETRDPIERSAMDIAHGLIERCDLLIAMRDVDAEWPALSREPDVFVMNKIDIAPVAGKSHLKEKTMTMEKAMHHSHGAAATDPFRVSARTGAGIAELVQAIRDHLVSSADLAHPGLWLFDLRLEFLGQSQPLTTR